MKFAVVLFTIFAILQSQVNIAIAKATEVAPNSSSEESPDSSSEEELSSKEEACVDELHLDRQRIIDMPEIAPVDNDDFNKFTDCYWQKEEWIDSNGEIKYDKFLESVIEATKSEDENSDETWIVELRNVVAYCANNPATKGSTNGQTAVKFENCFKSKLLETMDLESEEEESVLSSKEEDCVEELHLDKNHIMKLNEKEVAPENNGDFNKFLACYWMKEEWMDSNGEINYDNLLFSLRAMGAIAYQGESHEVKSLMKKRIARAISYCQANATKGTTHGQTVAKLQNCLTAKLTKGFYR